MPVNSVKFNNMGCSPLKKDNNVSFARRNKEAHNAEKKSHKAAYIATGVGLAAAAAAAIVFRKQIGNFFSNLKINGLKENAIKAKDAVVDFGKNSTEYIKNKGAKLYDDVAALKNKAGEAITEGQAKIIPAMDKMKDDVVGITANMTSKSGEFFKKGWGYVVKGYNIVKDFAVNVFKKIAAFFNKAKTEAPKAAEAAAEAVAK